MAEKHQREFYEEVVKFVRRESCDIRPGTIGMTKAEIAKSLFAETPDLFAEDRRPELIKAVEAVYDRDHPAVVLKLTKEDCELARMFATHEDDLPQA